MAFSDVNGGVGVVFVYPVNHSVFVRAPFGSCLPVLVGRVFVGSLVRFGVRFRVRFRVESVFAWFCLYKVPDFGHQELGCLFCRFRVKVVTVFFDPCEVVVYVYQLCVVGFHVGCE